jgi:hypothetical protein
MPRLTLELHEPRAPAAARGRLLVREAEGGLRADRPVALAPGRFEFELGPGRYDVLFQPDGAFAAPGPEGPPPSRLAPYAIARGVRVEAGADRAVDAFPLELRIRDYDGALVPLCGAAVHLGAPGGGAFEPFLTDGEGMLCAGLEAARDVHLGTGRGSERAWLAPREGPIEALFGNTHLGAPAGSAFGARATIELAAPARAGRPIAATLPLPGAGDPASERARGVCRELSPLFLDSLAAFAEREDRSIVHALDRDLLLAFALCGKASAKLRALLDLDGRLAGVRQVVAGRGTNVLTGQEDSMHSFLRWGDVVIDPTIAQFQSGHGDPALRRAATAKLPPSTLRWGFVGTEAELAAFLACFRWEPLPPELAEKFEPALERVYRAAEPLETAGTAMAAEARSVYEDHRRYVAEPDCARLDAYRAAVAAGRSARELDGLAAILRRELEPVAAWARGRRAGSAAG